MKEDRLMAGVVSGTVAILIQTAYALTVKSLGFTDRIYVDFAKVIIMSENRQGLSPFFIGLIAQLVIGAMFGVVFAFVEKFTSSRYYIVKGVFFGAVLWFLLTGFGTMWRLPVFSDMPTYSAYSTLTGSLIYGLALAYTMKLLEKHTNLL